MPHRSGPLRTISLLSVLSKGVISWPGIGFVGSVLLCAAFLYLPFIVWAWWEQPATGDLVRIGGWSARLYGWNAKQPVVRVRHNKADRAGANVWVLGDSFSEGNIWQSVWAEESRERVYTQGYKGHGCMNAFVDQALIAYNDGLRYVVIQTVERHLLDRFSAALSCPAEGNLGDTSTTAPGVPALVEGPAGGTSPVRNIGFSTLMGFPPFGAGRWLPKVDWRYLASARLNELRVEAIERTLPAGPDAAETVANRRVVRSGDTMNSPLLKAGLFSSRRSERLLYFFGDAAKSQWSRAELAHAAGAAERVQERLRAAGIGFLLLVIPDKSSVYRPWLPEAARAGDDTSLLEVFNAAGVSVEFPLQQMRGEAAQVLDFYLPDDTHLSPVGFRWLGRHIATVAAHRARAQ